MNLTSRVYRVSEPGKVDHIVREVRDPAPDEVVIKVCCSAICGSDLHIYKGLHPSVKLPSFIGHEFSGVIHTIGEEVTALKPGDRVTLEPCICCGKCEACKRGEYNFCENISFTYRIGDGAMADYVVAKAEHVFKLPDDLSFEEGALIEPMSVAMHAVRRADIKIGETVVIIGAGAIGLLVTAICRIHGAGKIIVADFDKTRLEAAKDYGATRICCSSEEDLEEVVKQETGGKGVGRSFDCVGRESVFRQALSVLKKNGLATIVGIYEHPQISFDVSQLVTKEIRIQGTQGYCFDFPLSLRFAKEVNLKRIITHEYPLDQLDQAFKTCFDKTSGAIKVILKP